MKKFKALLSILVVCAVVITCFAGCSSLTSKVTGSDDIVILFTGNGNNAALEGVTYSGVSSYKSSVMAGHNLVATVDLGNSISGGSMDMVAEGEYGVTVLNEVGYDYYVPGVNDFSLDMEKLCDSLNSKLVSSTAEYNGEGELEIAPYVMAGFSGKNVALVGVTGKGAGNEKFSLSTDENFVSDIEEAVEDAKTEGADYVILLANLPSGDAINLVAGLTGVTVVLNADEVVPQKMIKDADDKDVIYSSCGSNLAGIGQLTISATGTVTTTVVTTDGRDEDTDLVVKGLNDKYEAMLTQTIGTAPSALSINNDAGIRTVQTRETTIGDFVADAYRAKTQADIALVSADEIATGLEAGDIKLSDVMAVTPAKDNLCVVEMTGAQIADCLEFAVQNVSAYYASYGQANGEFPGFFQVSGIAYVVNTSVENAVVVNDDGSFASLNDTRRVSNITVRNAEGQYIAIDPEATYTVAGSTALLRGASNGNTLATAGTVKQESAGTDYEAVIDFIKSMENTTITGYEVPQGRISVR